PLRSCRGLGSAHGVLAVARRAHRYVLYRGRRLAHAAARDFRARQEAARSDAQRDLDGVHTSDRRARCRSGAAQASNLAAFGQTGGSNMKRSAVLAVSLALALLSGGSLRAFAADSNESR